MRLAAILTVLALCLGTPARLRAQETEVLNNQFDPYAAALTFLPRSSFIQEGDTVVDQIEANISTFRVRATGRIESYLKVKIGYLVSANVPTQRQIRIVGAFYEGGAEADFETIESTVENCVVTRTFGEACRVRETLSVRLPSTLTNRAPFQVQFRNRTSSWRGTVTVPTGTIARNLQALADLR